MQEKQKRAAKRLPGQADLLLPENTGVFSLSGYKDNPLRLPSMSDPVYLTRSGAAKLAGVNFRTFEHWVEPDAWRREADGALSPLYAEAAVEEFKTTWRGGRFKADGGAE
jgi:hypothetical protein